MPTGKIVYFDRAGQENTEAVIEVVRERCAELKIEHVVVASDTGATALLLSEALGDIGVRLIAVPEHAGYAGGDDPSIAPDKRRELEAKGIHVLICAHALSGVGRSLSKKFGGITPTEVIAHTLRRFGGDGIKVAVEVAVMAADAGLIPTDREVIAVGGSGRGADAAIVLRAAHMNNFFDLEIREILAKPRQRISK
ncbi:MAG: pyruvate kinase alpha/beta domain-containing protein [Candidatus Latescibacterota bacterium]